MERSAIIRFDPDAETAPQQTIASGAFVVDYGLVSNPITTLVLRLPFSIPESGNFILESVVVEVNGNASLSVRRITEPAESLFLAMWVWEGRVDPYFGVRLPANGTIHIYLRNSPLTEHQRHT
jgi:hypothetical protein